MTSPLSWLNKGRGLVLKSRLSTRKPMSVRPKAKVSSSERRLGTTQHLGRPPAIKEGVSFGISATGFGSNENKRLRGGDHSPGDKGEQRSRPAIGAGAAAPGGSQVSRLWPAHPEHPSSSESDVPEHRALHIPRAQRCCRGLFQEEFYWKCSFVRFFFPN